MLCSALPRDGQDANGGVARAPTQCTAGSWKLRVLHDLPTGAMRHLDRFLDRAAAIGARFRQDFPPPCVPIRNGAIALPIQAYVSSIEESERP